MIIRILTSANGRFTKDKLNIYRKSPALMDIKVFLGSPGWTIFWPADEYIP
jgi:hypothetical protein